MLSGRRGLSTSVKGVLKNSSYALLLPIQNLLGIFFFFCSNLRVTGAVLDGRTNNSCCSGCHSGSLF